jgi:L-asparaginase / beta-aspartyl-peptidase
MHDTSWSIIVHGGAGAIKPEKEEESKKAALKALEEGVNILKEGGKAIDAVERAIKSMESGSTFNAGRGSVRRSDGKAYLDASIMDGRTLAIGSVAGIQGIENPISVAKFLLNESPILLFGEYATQFAQANGFRVEKDIYSPEGISSCDTVGCVTRDQEGNIACGLSTGGLSSRMPGGVGDSPLPGCGFYADNERGGLCLSGDGESISRVLLAAEIMNRLEKMKPEEAIEDGLLLLNRVKGEAGCILIDKNGTIAWSHRSDNYAIAFQTQDSKPFVSLKKDRAGTA